MVHLLIWIPLAPVSASSAVWLPACWSGRQADRFTNDGGVKECIGMMTLVADESAA